MLQWAIGYTFFFFFNDSLLIITLQVAFDDLKNNPKSKIQNFISTDNFKKALFGAIFVQIISNAIGQKVVVLISNKFISVTEFTISEVQSKRLHLLRKIAY